MSLAAFPLMLLGNQLGSRFFGTVEERVWRGLVVALLCVATLGALSKLWA
jgi:uncharacterized membrane protein YfcA